MQNGWIKTVAVLIAFTALGCSKGSDSTVIARVNQTRITAAEFKRQLEGLDNIQMERAVATDARARKEFLDDIIGIELVSQEAKRQGLDKEPEYKKTLDALKKEYEEAKKRLDRRYQDAMRNELFKSVLKKDLTEKAGKLTPPTDKEIREFYERNRAKMVTTNGKQLSLKDVEPQIKQRLYQEKQRDLYLEYIKGLREKAKVTIDEKALETLASSLTATATLQVPQLQPEVGKQEGEKGVESK
jgi:hypothetical protein